MVQEDVRWEKHNPFCLAFQSTPPNPCKVLLFGSQAQVSNLCYKNQQQQKEIAAGQATVNKGSGGGRGGAGMPGVYLAKLLISLVLTDAGLGEKNLALGIERAKQTLTISNPYL